MYIPPFLISVINNSTHQPLGQGLREECSCSRTATPTVKSGVPSRLSFASGASGLLDEVVLVASPLHFPTHLALTYRSTQARYLRYTQTSTY